MVEVAAETTSDGNAAPRLRSTGRRVTPERMRRIAEVAGEIAVESGFAAVTMQAVAKGTGYVRPVVYDCYGTPENILLTMLDNASSVLLEALAENAGPVEKRSASALVTQLMPFFDTILAQPREWQLFTLPTEGATPAVKQCVQEFRDRIRGSIESWLRTATRDLREDCDTEALSVLVLAAIDAIAARIIADPRAHDTQRIVTFLESLTRSARLVSRD